MIVGGNFQRVGAVERLGLARILPDGTVDPLWDPAPALGIELDGSGVLNALPISVGAGPEGSVLLRMRSPATDNQPYFSLATLDGDGAVVASFASPGMGAVTVSIVQPDGRALIGSSLTGEPMGKGLAESTHACIVTRIRANKHDETARNPRASA